tara:strand:- start:15382 stop:15663 length:282 start_codon:yes stop_codon:yes gene_type:complete
MIHWSTASATETLFSWRAPATDYYVFDTIGSEFDTVIALKNECDGEELNCNNNLSTDATASELVQKIISGGRGRLCWEPRQWATEHCPRRLPG